ncbi:hypothetical protein K0M31_006459 [Melipona bicolor]|uniref:Uncharacterized protein n=1 Tax=Melipona bicolor TaxID=60889 RepID=A0AA40FTL1_9HYME|nr:hypothetical protein K0M31_006459 [Melipona bicolor]
MVPCQGKSQKWSFDKSANVERPRRRPGRRCAMDLYWQSIKFLRPIYIDWFIHRIEAVVNKCTAVHAAPRISPFTTESPEKRKGRGKKKKKKKKEKKKEKKKKKKKKKGTGTDRHRGEGERKEKKRRNLESDGALDRRGVVISVQIARVRIRRSNGERNGGQTPSRWTLDGVRVHPRRCPRQLNKERKHTRRKKYKKRKTTR